MTTPFDEYRSPDAPIPHQTWAWNMYGAGLEQIGRDGQPERFPVPEIGADQLLVRVDAVSLCFSDVKLIQQGGKHPKLYNRDLQTEPTRLGHETAVTVMAVGANLHGQYQPGERLAIQPDIYQQGKSTAYGYTIPGGLIQFHLLGPEVLAADDGAYVLPVGERLGYAEAALTEPWACVEGAYRQRRRLTPKDGGVMWIVGRPGDTATYQFSEGLAAPATIVLTDVPEHLRALIERSALGRIVERNSLTPADYPALKDELTRGQGFDDIVVLDPRSAEAVGAAAKLIARRGTFNLVGRVPLDGLPQIDVGRIHYDYTAYLGNPGPDIAASYGEAHNRSELRAGGVTLFVGAGGPMGQMHIQRAIELPGGPKTLIATDVNDERLAVLWRQFASLAEEHGKRLILVNPQQAGVSLRDLVLLETDGAGADDVIVSVPSAALMADAAALMAPNGMLVLFAGVPNGTLAPLNLSDVYLHNAQFTGTSGSALDDQAAVIRKTIARELTPNRSVAAIGGIEAARDGVRAMMEGRYPGKIVIFPQISGLPLMSLAELKAEYPDVAAKLGPNDVWTPAAEQALIERFWRP
ncbi:MAG TPA: alcohol dehydrogenase catalytic domain-containing protein [Roseiflexaceae bacterium]|nr:alcohol dehydrogenase catalytic domain-containing protein [Roseiflexaceae bacterium]